MNSRCGLHLKFKTEKKLYYLWVRLTDNGLYRVSNCRTGTSPTRSHPLPILSLFPTTMVVFPHLPSPPSPLLYVEVSYILLSYTRIERGPKNFGPCSLRNPSYSLRLLRINPETPDVKTSTMEVVVLLPWDRVVTQSLPSPELVTVFEKTGESLPRPSFPHLNPHR